MYQTRQATERVLQLVEDGLLDRDTVIMACLKYMSEDDVADMAQAIFLALNLLATLWLRYHNGNDGWLQVYRRKALDKGVE